MCGRYVSPDEAAIERAWHVGRQNSNPFSRRFNVAPTSTVPFITGNESGQPEVSSARCGLIPSWWKEAKPPRYGFNAGFEEIATKQCGGSRCATRDVLSQRKAGMSGRRSSTLSPTRAKYCKESSRNSYICSSHELI